MLAALLLACSSNLADSVSSDIEIDSASESEIEVTYVEPECYELDLENGGTACYGTRPYFTMNNGFMVAVEEAAVVVWTMNVRAAAEGWVEINNLNLALSFADMSGSGWTDEVMDRLSYTDQNGDEHGIGVMNSNPSGKSLVIGEAVGSQGNLAVPRVGPAESAMLTFTLDVDGLDLCDGDTVGLGTLNYQTWSGNDASSMTTAFGAMTGTTFYFP
ncbi:MAG: hypothetical protein AAB473_01560 [Patescibacteria group bacterium]